MIIQLRLVRHKKYLLFAFVRTILESRLFEIGTKGSDLDRIAMVCVHGMCMLLYRYHSVLGIGTASKISRWQVLMRL